jgi:hypothetical protein
MRELYELYCQRSRGPKIKKKLGLQKEKFGLRDTINTAESTLNLNISAN